jgi:hypothetical protein
MLTLMEVRCSTRPICSAMPMNLRRAHPCAWLRWGGGCGGEVGVMRSEGVRA